ncbi:telomere-protecting terminal protein Tpg [Streptomyces sp. NPDC059578]|uniref:telomere-protecting terminal protein Tpg n=1 Tax=Streptomyces sp. NPDC059578 TaxID=3346874 RepID=UPI0036B7BE4B
MADDDIRDALTRLSWEQVTRQPPATPAAQVRFLLKRLGSANAVAAALGVRPDSVRRYARGARTPRGDIAARIAGELRQHWQPLVRKRALDGARGGITVECRAAFGYVSAPGSTDDWRYRRITAKLDATDSGRLIDAFERGANEKTLRAIVADGIRHVYFQDGGRRADDLREVYFSDIDYIDFGT